MNDQTLTVLIAGEVAGLVEQHSNGTLTFEYDNGYSGALLSSSMPLSNRVYPHEQVHPFLFGLLPDNNEVRRSIAAEFDISPDNPFDMLRYIGLDCPGAVQLCPSDQVEDAIAKEGEVVALSDSDIASRLNWLRTHEFDSWLNEGERWSLGGAQTKFALRREGGTWCECHGSAATTHIFKSGISMFQHQALNEFLCMRTAAECGIEAARVEYARFQDEPAIIVERYDRARTMSGRVLRLHQEDFCQMLGVLPRNKYASDGGPSTPQMLAAIKGFSALPREDVLLFTQMLFFNYLLGAPDAHAKNYSMLISADDGAILAPMYDVASILPYRKRNRTYRMAMSIGGENRIGWVRASSVRKYAENNGLEEYGMDADACARLMAHLAERVPRELAGVVEQEASIEGVEELAEQLVPAVEDLCRNTLNRL